MPRSLARLCAAALVLSLGACKGEARSLGGVPPEPDSTPNADTAAKADTQKTAAGAPAAAPAPPNAPPAPAPDTCEPKRELKAWSDSARSVPRYGDYLVLQIALMELDTRTQLAPGTPAATADSAAAARVCAAAQERELSAFLRAYRPFAPTTMLTPILVGKLGELGPRIDPFADDSTDGGGESTGASSDSIVHRVEVPRAWLAALLAFIAVAGAALVYMLWRLGWTIEDSAKRLHESNQRQLTHEMTNVRTKVEHWGQSLQKEVGAAHATTRTEVQGFFTRVGAEVAKLRESLANSTGGSSGTSDSSGESRARGGGELRVSHDPFGHDQWEETVVDVRPADGGSASIHADDMGVFIVRFARGSTAEARLLVHPDRVIGAALRDKLDAAFRCRGVPRRTDRYRTVQDAFCTWNPATAQGRITHLGEVEEAG